MRSRIRMLYDTTDTELTPASSRISRTVGGQG